MSSQATLMDSEVHLQPKRRIRRRRKRKVTRNQTSLVTAKTFSHMAEEQAEREFVQALRDEVEFIEHAVESETFMFGAVLSIERYAGRSLPWYLSPEAKAYQGTLLVSYGPPDNCKTISFQVPDDIPSISDYEIGWYGNDNQPGTRKFILDRLRWAHKVLSEVLEENEQILKELEESRGWS